MAGWFDGLFGGSDSGTTSTASSGSGWGALLPVLIEAGVGAIGGISASNSAKDTADKNEALARDRMAMEQDQFAQNLELAKLKLAQGGGGGGSGAAEAIARQRLIQEAYQALIQASLQGSSNEVTALNNLTNAAQRPLLGR